MKRAEVVIIDFEDSIRDRNFIFADYLDVIFDSNTLSFNLNELQKISNRLADFHIDIAGADGFKSIVQICLIRHCLRKSISLKITVDEKERLVRFVETVLADDALYLKWLHNIENKGE